MSEREEVAETRKPRPCGRGFSSKQGRERLALGEASDYPELAQWASGGDVVHLPPPSDDDVAAILARVLRQAKKDFTDLHAAWPEDEYEEGQRESLQRPLGLELPPTPRRRRVAVAHGFSLHGQSPWGRRRWEESGWYVGAWQ